MKMKNNTIAIYSVGLLGASIGLAFKESGFKGKIIGFSSKSSLEKSIELGCIDEGYGYEELQNRIGDVDILFLCSPINTIIDTIKKMASMKLPDGIVITDVGSTKLDIINAATCLPSHVHFVGGHPMAGSEKSGPSAADPFLFQNAIYVLSNKNGTETDLEKSMAVMLKQYLGCRTIFLNPSTHDHIAATVSHVPHLLAVALVLLARETDEKTAGTLTLAAGGFRDMTRIASASYPMWHDILVTNKTEIAKQLDKYIDILGSIKEMLANNSLNTAFEKSRETRSRVSSSGKGFISQMSEVLIHAKDQPGFIASVATILTSNNINIKDIEVVKVREGEGGTIRLAFESPEISRRAISLLVEQGFSARERN
jgi:prephenate dehydrogenase